MHIISPKNAFGLLQQRSDAVLIDVRSELEASFVGHPAGAVCIPWINDEWEIKPAEFTAAVRVIAQPAQPVLLICRSGNRSGQAGRVLEAAGYTDVYNIEHGFEGDLDAARHRNSVNGWRVDGLPWEQC